MTGRTDIEIEISNQCAMLVANAVIYSGRPCKTPQTRMSVADLRV
ncbi:MAG: hypothetical protein NWQ05_00670 [Burkholderiaceae bacterium]|nr:hypothetical protein [Burkholderiaceae bacterium]